MFYHDAGLTTKDREHTIVICYPDCYSISVFVISVLIIYYNKLYVFIIAIIIISPLGAGVCYQHAGLTTQDRHSIVIYNNDSYIIP